MSDLPEVRRVSLTDHVRAATDAGRKDDPDRAALLLGAASQLKPLHAIQVAFDALARTATDLRAGVPDPYAKTLGYHAGEALRHVEYHRDVLKAGYEAAEAMIAEMKTQTSSLENAMAKQKPEHPKLTNDGSPHPLEEGGYDANSDPALPGNISDVEALKEGKQTRAQTEAIAQADLAETEGHAPAAADGTDKDEESDPKGGKKSDAKTSKKADAKAADKK